MQQSFLIITLAMNGYQWAYRKFIDTHKDYARKFHAQHVEVVKPSFTRLGVECCWLKLHILKQALMSGYRDVLILDADAWVNPSCPDIRQSQQREKHIYMAKGYSDRFNSGVLWVHNTPESIRFVTKVINHRLDTVPLEDDVGWGENGHIIHHARTTTIVGELDLRWNNTHQLGLDDYIRHYNHGPFRSSLCRRLLHKALARTSRAWFKLLYFTHISATQTLPSEWFELELDKVLHYYPSIRCQRTSVSNCKINLQIKNENQKV